MEGSRVSVGHDPRVTVEFSGEPLNVSVRLPPFLPRALVYELHLQMDCTLDENKEFKEKMGIKGFPSFRVSTLCRRCPRDVEF